MDKTVFIKLIKLKFRAIADIEAINEAREKYKFFNLNVLPS